MKQDPCQCLVKKNEEQGIYLYTQSDDNYTTKTKQKQAQNYARTKD